MPEHWKASSLKMPITLSIFFLIMLVLSVLMVLHNQAMTLANNTAKLNASLAVATHAAKIADSNTKVIEHAVQVFTVKHGVSQDKMARLSSKIGAAQDKLAEVHAEVKRVERRVK